MFNKCNKSDFLIKGSKKTIKNELEILDSYIDYKKCSLSKKGWEKARKEGWYVPVIKGDDESDKEFFNRKMKNITETKDDFANYIGEELLYLLQENLKRTSKIMLLENINQLEFQTDLFLQRGAPIISYNYSEKMKIYKNENFKIIDFKKKNMKIRNKKTRKYEVKEVYCITLKNNRKKIDVDEFTFMKYFTSGYAITTHKAQGQTIDKPYTIWEFSKLKKEENLMYTALSRATRKNLINII